MDPYVSDKQLLTICNVRIVAKSCRIICGQSLRIYQQEEQRNRFPSHTPKHRVFITWPLTPFTQSNHFPASKVLYATIIGRKTKQHDNDLVNLLTEIKLKEKAGTQMTSSRIKDAVTWIVHMCVARTFSPLGKCTKEEIELVILVNNEIEWIMWSVAPESRTQVSSL